MLNQLTMDKENVPLALDDTHKATRDEMYQMGNVIGQMNDLKKQWM